jgi:predicted Zn-dependent protease
MPAPSRVRSRVAARSLAPLLALALGACAISRSQESQMGEEYARELNAQLALVADPEINRYLSVLGDSIAAVSGGQVAAWHFYLVDSRAVNAFAVPGGYIYVTRGLVERTEAMTELAGVLGHEIAHVVRRHSVEQMERAQRANVGVTLACVLTGVCGSEAAQAGIQIGGAAVFARYSRSDESEADRDAVGTVVRAGIHPRGIVTMFERLLAERQRSPAALDEWFATHPTEEARIAEVQKVIAAIDSTILATLGTDTPRYHSFRDRVRALPPSPEADSSGR